MVTNADRLGLDLSGVHAVVLSRGHFDHTGWRAQHTLAAALPDSWVQRSSGTRYQLTSS